jgi:hypothetical protein
MTSLELFKIIAWSSTGLFIIKLGLSSLVDHDAGGEWHDGLHAPSGWDDVTQYISLQSVLAFGMGLGWTGFIGLDILHWSALSATVLGLGVGVVMVAFSLFLLFQMRKLNVKPRKHEPKIGQIVETYTDVFPEPHVTGSIKVEILGRIDYYRATSASQTIPAFSQAVIVDVLDSGIIVIERKV